MPKLVDMHRQEVAQAYRSCTLSQLWEMTAADQQQAQDTGRLVEAVLVRIQQGTFTETDTRFIQSCLKDIMLSFGIRKGLLDEIRRREEPFRREIDAVARYELETALRNGGTAQFDPGTIPPLGPMVTGR